MDILSLFHGKQPIRFGIGSILFGAFFIAISLTFLLRPRAELVEASATVVEIVEGYDPIEEETVMTAYIDYEAEGIQYKHAVSPSYSYEMEVGSVISVFYDRENPELLSSTDSDLIIYIALAIGVLSVISGGVSIVRLRRSGVC